MKKLKTHTLVGVLTLLLGCGAQAVPDSAATAPAPQAQPAVSEDETADDVDDAAESTETDSGEAPLSKDIGAATASEAEAYANAKPVFEKYCVSCHTTSSRSAKKKALKHLVMDTYPFAGHHADELGTTILKALGQKGKKATMPKGKVGAVKGDDLELIVAWANAFDLARSTSSQPPKPHANGDEHKHQKKPKKPKKPKKAKHEHKKKHTGHQH